LGVRENKSNQETIGCCGGQDIKKDLIESGRESMDEYGLSETPDEDKLE
jgi:hypothetical protein